MINSDSGFMQARLRLQSELGCVFWDLLAFTGLHPFVRSIVGRVQALVIKAMRT